MDKVSVSSTTTPWLPVASRNSWPTTNNSQASSKVHGISPSDWSSSWTSSAKIQGNSVTQTISLKKESPPPQVVVVPEVVVPSIADQTVVVPQPSAAVGWINKNTAPSSAWAPQNVLPPTKQKKIEVAVQVVPSETVAETAPLTSSLVPAPPSELAPTAKSVIEEELSKQSLYKTELCRSFIETGICRYGHKCQFAHGEQELRPILRHPKYKTEHCKRFATTGDCPYGSRCRFIHTLGAPSGAAAPTPTQWSNTWTSATPLHAQFNKGNQTQADSAADAEDDQPRRLAIFQNLTKVN